MRLLRPVKIHNIVFLLTVLFFAVSGLVTFAAPSPDPSSKDNQTPLEVFAGHAVYEDIKLSPTGEYLAATFFSPDDVTESKLVVLDIKNMTVTASAHVRGNEFISNFFWANEERIVGQIAQKVGWQDQPLRKYITILTWVVR